jgi:hypothetical protein
MEFTNHNELYINIGMFLISKYIMMSKQVQLYVTNTETNETKIYHIYELFKQLTLEKLDADPLHDYLNEIACMTKEKRIETMKKFKEFGKCIEKEDK